MMTSGLAHPQPFTKKMVDLEFFITMVHRFIGVIVARLYMPMTVASYNFGHSGVMVNSHLELR